jgi:hypothetical protein
MPWTDNAAGAGKPGQKPTREWGPWGAVEPVDAAPPSPAPAAWLTVLAALWRRLRGRAAG